MASYSSKSDVIGLKDGERVVKRADLMLDAEDNGGFVVACRSTVLLADDQEAGGITLDILDVFPNTSFIHINPNYT